MPLKDTLEKIQHQQIENEKWERDKPNVIKTWQQAITDLFATVKGYLAEYQASGSLSFSEGELDLSEESLGRYQVKTLNIIAGPITVVIAPVGTMIVGAFGRIDMFRQGRVGEFERVVLLRIKSQDTYEWKIKLPLGAGNAGRGLINQPRRGGLDGTLEPLTKETFEQALEWLLR